MLKPLRTIGILGGGQLAKMLAQAAQPFHFNIRCLEPSAQACAKNMAEVITGDFDNLHALEKFSQGCDVITFENENIPLETISFLKQKLPVFPDEKILAVTQDRFFEKECFKTFAIPTNDYIAVSSLNALQAGVQKLGVPCVLKTRRFGYDGKGQFLIKTPADAIVAWETLGVQPLILEAFVPFETEVSLIATRNIKGNIVYYPLTENTHAKGILRLSQAPYLRPTLETLAKTYMEKVLTEFQYVGTLAIEFFVIQDQLWANEIAPRVHNSGHWTIEGSVTSQFENHIRAIADLPLGSTQTQGYSAMVNCIGNLPAIEQVLAIPYAHYHCYGKAPRPDRKLGHVTIQAETKSLMQESLGYLQQIMRE